MSSTVDHARQLISELNSQPTTSFLLQARQLNKEIDLKTNKLLKTYQACQ